MRIMGDSRENERRISEEVNRQGRRQKLLYEAESSARQNAAVAMKWSALFDKEIPQELLQEIEMQRDTCDRIIQSKDRLIKEFKTELKAKDDEYVKSLKKQAEDIDLLLERMGRQYGMLRTLTLTPHPLPHPHPNPHPNPHPLPNPNPHPHPSPGMLRKAFEDELDDVETAFMQVRGRFRGRGWGRGRGSSMTWRRPSCRSGTSS